MKQLLLLIFFASFIGCGSSSEQKEEPPTYNPTPEVEANNDRPAANDYPRPDTAVSIVDEPKLYTEVDYIGRRNVILQITETDCSGRAVGDTRPETWSISIEGGEIKMKVNSDTKTIENYTGEMAGMQLLLKGKHESLLGTNSQATIKLYFNGSGKIEGTRKLSTTDDRGNACQLEQSVKEQ